MVFLYISIDALLSLLRPIVCGNKVIWLFGNEFKTQELKPRGGLEYLLFWRDKLLAISKQISVHLSYLLYDFFLGEFIGEHVAILICIYLIWAE